MPRKTNTNHRPTSRRQFNASNSRLADCSINTVTKLLVDIGCACQFHQAQIINNVDSKRVQCDEIWRFCHSKEKYIVPEDRGTRGHVDLKIWTAIDAYSKVAISWLVGCRDQEFTETFIDDHASRLADRIH